MVGETTLRDTKTARPDVTWWGSNRVEPWFAVALFDLHILEITKTNVVLLQQDVDARKT